MSSPYHDFDDRMRQDVEREMREREIKDLKEGKDLRVKELEQTIEILSEENNRLRKEVKELKERLDEQEQ